MKDKFDQKQVTTARLWEKAKDKSQKKKPKVKKKRGRGSLVTFLFKAFLHKLIKIIGSHVQSKISKDLKDAKEFSVMLDSTQDIAVINEASSDLCKIR